MTVTESPLAEFRALLSGVRETRNFPYQGIELREAPDGTGGTTLTFEGCACATERDYPMWDAFGEYAETVHAGSFARTLAEGPDVAFLVNHEGITLARTKANNLELVENGAGLQARARLNPRSAAVQELRLAVDDGNLDQMSFAFRVDAQEWSDDWMRRDIHGVNLHRGDVSAVNFGANEAAAIASLRHARGSQLEDSERLYVYTLRAIADQLRAGATLSTSTLATLQQVLDLVAGADDNVDDAQLVLSGLMGVPNPDKPPDGPGGMAAEMQMNGTTTYTLPPGVTTSGTWTTPIVITNSTGSTTAPDGAARSEPDAPPLNRDAYLAALERRGRRS